MKHLLTLIFALSVVAGFAQTGSISGKIVDVEQEPLSGVNVSLEASNIGTVTDIDGQFVLENVAVGERPLEISYVGFTTQTLSVVVQPNQTTTIEVALEEGLDLQSVEIIGRRATTYKNDASFAATKVATPIKDIPQAISYVTKEVMADRQAYRVNDVVKNVSGVNQFSYYNDFTMRGFRSDIELVNGLRVPRLFGPQTIVPYLERVEVIKGPASALFGNTNPGGTMNRVTKKPLNVERKAITFTTRAKPCCTD